MNFRQLTHTHTLHEHFVVVFCLSGNLQSLRCVRLPIRFIRSLYEFFFVSLDIASCPSLVCIHTQMSSVITTKQDHIYYTFFFSHSASFVINNYIICGNNKLMGVGGICLAFLTTAQMIDQYCDRHAHKEFCFIIQPSANLTRRN